MGLLDRLENLIQGVIEGSTNSVLRQEIKPIEIEQQLEIAMRTQAQPSRGGKLAPHNFIVKLHPDVFRETIAGMEGYNRRCEAILNQYAVDQGFVLLQPRITVVFDTDAALGHRDIHVETNFEAPPTPRVATAPRAQSLTQTQVFSGAHRTEVDSPWRLVANSGKGGPNTPVTIPIGVSVVGRSTESDIVLRDEHTTISRRHAQFDADMQQLRIRDLNSKNGTRVDGNYIPSNLNSVVREGSVIEFGEYAVQVRRTHTSEV